jgi:hypothetical protein
MHAGPTPPAAGPTVAFFVSIRTNPRFFDKDHIATANFFYPGPLSCVAKPRHGKCSGLPRGFFALNSIRSFVGR